MLLENDEESNEEILEAIRLERGMPESTNVISALANLPMDDEEEDMEIIRESMMEN